MGKGNGKTEVETAGLDLEHELPRQKGGRISPGSDRGAAETVEPAEAESEKLKAERDALLDRLARLQAEFDNARSRAPEQQDFREFAAPMSSRLFCRCSTASSAR